MYGLDRHRMRAGVARFLALRPVPGGRFVALVVGTGDELSVVARSLERTVFEESFGNNASTMTAEYGAYEDGSWFIVVLDRDRDEMAGAIRVIEDTGHGLKSVNDATVHIGRSVAEITAFHGMADGGHAVDIATLAVLPGYRGGRSALMVSTLLYRTLFVQLGIDGVRHVVAMIDRNAYRNLSLIGMPFVPMMDSAPFDYLGSAENRALYGEYRQFGPGIEGRSVALRQQGWSSLPDVRRMLFRRVAARVANAIVTGDGLDRHISLRHGTPYATGRDAGRRAAAG